MSERRPESDGRYRVAMPRFVNPALAQQVSRGSATGTIEGGKVQFGSDSLRVKGDDVPSDGTEVEIREDDSGLYCKTVEQAEREQREREREQAERRREREHDRARREDRRRAEAVRFWEDYKIPFAFGVRIKQQRSGLLRGSSGTGEAANTVKHLYVHESFEEGRLSRDADTYLCNNDAYIRDPADNTRSDSDGNGYTPRVTCATCLKRMQRWETNEATETTT